MNDDMKVADLIATLRESNLIKEARIETLEEDIKTWKMRYSAEKNEHEIDTARLENLRNACTLLEEKAAHDREQLGIADAALTKALEEVKKYKDAYMHTCDNYRLHEEIKQKDERIKHLERAVDIERSDYMEAEKARLRAKGSLDSKQAEIRKERQRAGKAEEEMRAMERERDYWKRQYENIADAAQKSHDQAVQYANRLGRIETILNERD